MLIPPITSPHAVSPACGAIPKERGEDDSTECGPVYFIGISRRRYHFRCRQHEHRPGSEQESCLLQVPMYRSEGRQLWLSGKDGDANARSAGFQTGQVEISLVVYSVVGKQQKDGMMVPAPTPKDLTVIIFLAIAWMLLLCGTFL